ncbi:hypothetical protein CPB86DRAFT_465127 [Serendipita vermifera]|nr:hypothetical protein CPB86DRAFT_465127 [Serendipita vermifera]
MSKQAFIFFPQVAPVGWHLMEEYHDDGDQLIHSIHSLGQEFVDLAEDVHMFLKYLEHHPIIDGKLEWNPLKSVISIHLADSCFIVAATMRDCFTFLLSLPVVKERGPIQTRLIAIHKKLLDSAKSSQYSGNMSRHSLVSFTEPIEAYTKLRQARLQLSRSLKYSISHDPSKVVDLRNSGRKRTTIPLLIDKLHRLHRKYPFSIGGPLLDDSNLLTLVPSFDKLNVDVGIHWLKAASSQEGQRWVYKGSQEGKDRRQAGLMEIFWTTALEQVRQIPGRNGHPNSRRFELMLRSRMCQSDASLVTVAVLGLVNSGKSTFINSLIGQPILPSGIEVTTTWPCLIRHKKKCKKPVMTCFVEPFIAALQEIRKRGIGPQLENPSHRNQDLPRTTKENLKLYHKEWCPSPEAAGLDAVRELLADINDIRRLCSRFELDFDEQAATWPEITVEFSSLPDSLGMTCQFIDVPGIADDAGQSSSLQVISRIITQSDAIIPVMDGVESETSLWRKLPFFIRRLGRPANLVICTRLDMLNDIVDQRDRDIQSRREIISAAFDITEDRVVVCTPSHYLGAQVLMAQSTPELKPVINFGNAKHSLEIATIYSICGNERNFHRSTASDFFDDLQALQRRAIFLSHEVLRRSVLASLPEKRLKNEMLRLYLETDFLVSYQE